MEGIRDEEWEKLEADDPTDDLEGYENIDDDNEEEEGENKSVKEEGDGGGEECRKTPAGKESPPTDPSIVYANEPPVYYYSNLEAISAVRQRLSTKWERGLCANFDNLIAQLEKSKPKVEPKVEEEEKYSGQHQELENVKALVKTEDQVAKWPKALSLLPSLNASQLNALIANSQLAISAQKNVDEDESENRAPAPMEIAYVLELSGGILILNQDGIFENFPIPPEVHAQRIKVRKPCNILFYASQKHYILNVAT